MRKLVIKIVLFLAAVWLLAVFFSWQHAYSKAYTDEMVATGPCSCESSNVAWRLPYDPSVTFTVNGQELQNTGDSYIDFDAIQQCIEGRARSEAFGAVFGMVAFGVFALFALLMVTLTAAIAVHQPKQD